MKSFSIIKILLIIFILTLGVSAQFYGGSKYSGVGLPFFELALYRSFNLEKATPQINVYIELLYDDLTFIKHDSLNQYDAKFELIAAIYDSDENQVAARIVTKDVSVQTYELTNSRDDRIQINRTLDIPEGNYVLKLRVTDLISKKTLSQNIEFSLENMVSADLALSDLLFLNDLEVDSSGSVISVKPRVRDNFSRESNYFYIYFDVYSRKVPATLDIKYEFIDSEGDVQLDTVLVANVKKPVTSQIFKIDKHWLSGNRYRCRVEVDNGDENRESTKGFSFYWVATPETTEDISLAIRQMRYLGVPDSIDKYEDAAYDEQKQFFDSFWRSRDPNPNTEVNELMVEYYNRINHANREFSNFNEGGWLSDRGRILVKFGQPDDIERHPFEIDTYPYEIWRFYSLRKIFIFADRTGFGDFRLLPEYMDEEFH
jgi:GWxTD domain-containing protein